MLLKSYSPISKCIKTSSTHGLISGISSCGTFPSTTFLKPIWTHLRSCTQYWRSGIKSQHRKLSLDSSWQSANLNWLANRYNRATLYAKCRYVGRMIIMSSTGDWTSWSFLTWLGDWRTRGLKIKTLWICPRRFTRFSNRSWFLCRPKWWVRCSQSLSRRRVRTTIDLFKT